jgi:hypothetical protein
LGVVNGDDAFQPDVFVVADHHLFVVAREKLIDLGKVIAGYFGNILGC